MATFRVTASVAFDYDTDDGLVSNVDEARQDVVDILSSGDLAPDDFTIDVVDTDD